VRPVFLPPWEEYRGWNGHYAPTADDRFFHTELWEPQAVADEIEKILRDIRMTGHSFDYRNASPGGALRPWEL
jgi:formate-dependent nitrite reductase cytochrome c552 subunit